MDARIQRLIDVAREITEWSPIEEDYYSRDKCRYCGYHYNPQTNTHSEDCSWLMLGRAIDELDIMALEEQEHYNTKQKLAKALDDQLNAIAKTIKEL